MVFFSPFEELSQFGKFHSLFILFTSHTKPTYINPGFVCSENQDNMVYIQKKNCIPKKAYRRLYLNNTKVVETFPICFDMIFLAD